MAAADRRIWAIDIGSNALKALCLHESGEGLLVSGFDYVEHDLVLSAEDLTEEEIQEEISKTLHTFVSQNDIDKKDHIAISIAGNKSFIRFVPLPPVEMKEVPKIVQFEAVQQIPFDINEVEWGWQLMEDDDSPEKIVGLFAIKNEILAEVLDCFSEVGLKVAYVQIAPMAMYNYLLHDRKDVGPSSGKATVILDMGAQDTTMIVATQNSVWQRTIRIGGNSFTEAISDAFKVRFKKAEKLKRTAPVSKYVRQIFSAMKPVFTDFSSEIQRSMNYYNSNEGGNGFSKIVVLGGGMKLKGLAKYLQQSLGVPVIKPDSFETLELDEGLSPAKFHEHVSDFGICYGLGTQAFGYGKIRTNLLPSHIARAMAFSKKIKMFNVAACILAFVSIICFGKAILDNVQYASADINRDTIQKIVSEAKNISSQVDSLKSKEPALEKKVQNEMEVFAYRDIVPRLVQDIVKCLPNAENSPSDASLHEAFTRGDIAAVKAIDRSKRKQLFITGLSVSYVPDVDSASFDLLSNKNTTGSLHSSGGASSSTTEQVVSDGNVTTGPGFVVVIEGYSPYAEIGGLMDPINPGKDKSRWGFITRLEKLSDIDKEERFVLYGKGNTAHFKQETDYINVDDSDIPKGIGVLKQIPRVPVEYLQDNTTTRRGAIRRPKTSNNNLTRITVEDVLVDPLTDEEMSSVYDIITSEDLLSDPSLTKNNIGDINFDRQGRQIRINRDSWFRISAKIRWMGAPEIDIESN